MAADTKVLVRRLFEEVWNQGNLAAIDELFAPSYVRYDPAAPEAKGLAGFKQLVIRLRTAFPDLHFTLEEVIAEGDKVMSRALLRGTHRGAQALREQSKLLKCKEKSQALHRGRVVWDSHPTTGRRRLRWPNQSSAH